MRFGGPVFGWSDPASWIAAHRKQGYRAAYFPREVADPEAYAEAAQEADLVVAEVGVWNNVLAPDPVKREEAIQRAIELLRLADRVGARCCVNIAGSHGERWDGPHAADLAPEALRIVAGSVRRIIDEAQPKHAKYALETMPYMLPDSAETSLALVEAVGRPNFGIHFDPVNMINCPRRFFENGSFMRDFVVRVGPHISAVHLKDIVLEPRLTVHLQEVRPGLGKLDTSELLRVVAERLDPDMPVMLEHLESEEDYLLAAEFVRSVSPYPL